MTVGFILMIAAFILFLIAAIGVPVPRINLMAAGLACWSLAVLVGGAKI